MELQSESADLDKCKASSTNQPSLIIFDLENQHRAISGQFTIENNGANLIYSYFGPANRVVVQILSSAAVPQILDLPGPAYRQSHLQKYYFYTADYPASNLRARIQVFSGLVLLHQLNYSYNIQLFNLKMYLYNGFEYVDREQELKLYPFQEQIYEIQIDL